MKTGTSHGGEWASDQKPMGEFVRRTGPSSVQLKLQLCGRANLFGYIVFFLSFFFIFFTFWQKWINFLKIWWRNEPQQKYKEAKVWDWGMPRRHPFMGTMNFISEVKWESFIFKMQSFMTILKCIGTQEERQGWERYSQSRSVQLYTHKGLNTESTCHSRG